MGQYIMRRWFLSHFTPSEDSYVSISDGRKLKDTTVG
jgi:hypothetical protein